MPKDFYKDIDVPKEFNKKLVEHAYEFAKNAHKGQKRKSGDLFISHPVEVAKILLDLGMSDVMAATALLHDTIEDTEVTYEQIEAEFDEEVARLVKSVTALRKIDFSTYSNPEEAEEAKNMAKNENLRQLFLSMAEDVRVVIIKLADRLHNMQTIKALSPKNQKRISLETLNVFAPLALRLGMGDIKGQLEDLAFPIAYPKEYKYVKKEANRRYKTADRYTIKVKRMVEDELRKSGVKVDIEGRAKHIYSLYKKVIRPDIDWDFDKIFDLVAIRIITETEEDCYKILGIIHGLFRPMPNKVKDYIAAPKPNGYRSIHTTIFGPESKIIEIQIRTREMHEEAEFGVASHLHYTEKKNAGKSSKELDEGKIFAKGHQTEFLKRIKEWQSSVGDDSDFLEGLKMEFLDDRIYVFSPNGDIFDLPVGATPVDFAYEIHSNIGDTCTGAKVNKRIVSLGAELKTRDVVEVITSKKGSPKRGWLDFVKTSKSKQHIRSHYRKFEYDKKRDEGLEIVEKELEILDYSISDFNEHQLKSAISATSFKTLDDLYASVGEGLTTKRQAVKVIVGRPLIPEEPKKHTKSVKMAQKTNFQGMMISVAPCCNPKKDDHIICYITRGRGLTVHKDKCKNLSHLEPNRLFEFNPWTKEKIVTEIEVLAEDRVGLIRDVSNIISSHGVNIETFANHHKPGSRRNKLIISISINELSECSDIIHDVSELESVITVKRAR